MTPIVLDASSGVEIALQTPVGRRLQARLPADAVGWVPEHYFAEAAAVLRRQVLHQRHGERRVEVALDRLLDAPLHRVSIRPLVREAWPMRHNLTIADLLYVVVAQHLGAPVVTTDLRLTRSPGLRVATITP